MVSWLGDRSRSPRHLDRTAAVRTDMESRRRWGQCNGNSCSRAGETPAADPDGIELTCVPPLPQDLEQHIRECQCSCDHLGFGNFKVGISMPVSFFAYNCNVVQRHGGINCEVEFLLSSV